MEKYHPPCRFYTENLSVKKTTMTWKVCAFLCQKRWKTPSKKKKTFLKTWKRRTWCNLYPPTLRCWSQRLGSVNSQFTEAKKNSKPNGTDVENQWNSRRYIFKWFECSIVMFVFGVGRFHTKTSLLQRIQTVPWGQHFRFSNHWVFDDLQPPSFFIGTSSTRLPPHHPYTAAFMWVPENDHRSRSWQDSISRCLPYC